MNELERLRNEIRRLDTEMRELFSARMDAAAQIGTYKRAHDLPVYDAERERENLAALSAGIGDAHRRALYREFLQTVMDLAKREQA